MYHSLHPYSHINLILPPQERSLQEEHWTAISSTTPCHQAVNTCSKSHRAFLPVSLLPHLDSQFNSRFIKQHANHLSNSHCQSSTEGLHPAVLCPRALQHWSRTHAGWNSWTDNHWVPALPCDVPKETAISGQSITSWSSKVQQVFLYRPLKIFRMWGAFRPSSARPPVLPEPLLLPPEERELL